MFIYIRLLELLVGRGGEFDSISKLVEETKWSKYAVRKALKELVAAQLVVRNKNNFSASIWGVRMIQSQDSNFRVVEYGED